MITAGKLTFGNFYLNRYKIRPFVGFRELVVERITRGMEIGIICNPQAFPIVFNNVYVVLVRSLFLY